MYEYENVACCGMEVHYKFSNVSFRDPEGRMIRRERLDHPDREKLRQHIDQWPKKLPVVMEASFGWGWLSDLMQEAGMEVHLSNCYKVEQMRFRSQMVQLQTMVKNRIHALFHRHGIFHEYSDLFRGRGRMFLSDLCLNGSPYLSPDALEVLKGQVMFLDYIRHHLADI